jgi:iron-sulfur cluster assembly protein
MSATVDQAVQTTPVQLTDDAVHQLNQIRMQEQVPEDYYLRVGVEGGGCSGFSYILRFDKVQPGDDTFEVKGVRVAMNKAHAIYLLGMEIDFLNGLANRGFTFNNPNASSTCGCGTSFSA